MCHFAYQHNDIKVNNKTTSFFLNSITISKIEVSSRYYILIFEVLLTVLHLSIFISAFNQLDAQNLFHNKFYFIPLQVSSTCAHHHEVKIALHNLWYHHTYRCDGV